jgi:type IX secretion system PorP/SprF family membrane protein
MRCLLLLGWLLPAGLAAQQLPLFSLYRENQGLLNPAAVHSDFLLYHDSYRLSAGATHRSQWVDGDGKIATQSARVEYIGIGEGRFAPLAGLYTINDQVGPTGFTGIYGRLASVFGLGHPNYGGFSVGLNAGYVQYRIKASQIDLLDPGDAPGQTDQSQWHPDVGLGLFFYKSIARETALVYAGLSAAQLFQLDLTLPGENGRFPLTRRPHFYAQAGAYKFLDNFSFLELSTWARYVDGAPFDLDVNLRYQFQRQFWVGGGAALNGNLHVEFGTYLLHLFDGEARGRPLVKLSAGFDYDLNPRGLQAGKAFEVNLSVLPAWNR